MNKQELLETYTAEQLAEMVGKLQEQIEVLQEILTEKERKMTNNIISVIVGGEVKEYQIEEIGDIVRAYEEIKMCQELNKQCKTILPTEYLRVLTLNQTVEEKQNEIEKLQSEVEKYRKAFKGAKNERDCQIAEYQKKIEELTKENKNGYVSLQQDPIDIASDLIKAFCWQGKEYLALECMELRQIAEHLLVYCNHNGKVEK